MSTEDILRKSRDRAKNIQDCYYTTAATLKRLHFATGIPLVILSTLAVSEILTDLKMFDSFAPYSHLVVSFTSLLVTVLAAIQSFLGFEKRSELHYRAGVKYGALKRDLEVIMQNPSDQEKLVALKELNARWNALVEESPIIPISIWRKHERKKREKDEKGTSAPPIMSAEQIAPSVTHAGGVVFRRAGEDIQYLVIQSSTNQLHWVLPNKQRSSPGSAGEAVKV